MDQLKDRVVLAVDIPAAQHSALIGRGGQHLNELQEKTGAQIQFPGSRSYPQVGEPENVDEVKDSEPGNIVKVVGSRAACLKAVEELKLKKVCSLFFLPSSPKFLTIISQSQGLRSQATLPPL